jgi:predicted 3-demethylubiquinone-9 3-methyltransferase (glyoxalase superfamily)
MTTVATCLWFDRDAEPAARFYVSLLPKSSLDHVQKYPADGPSGKEGDTLVVEFTLAGQRYQALNGGPRYPQTPAASIAVLVDDQAELDRLWAALTADGGKPVQCGWLTDKYGVSWQIVPEALIRLLRDPDAAKARRVMQAMLSMVKLDIAGLETAARG